MFGILVDRRDAIRCSAPLSLSICLLVLLTFIFLRLNWQIQTPGRLLSKSVLQITLKYGVLPNFTVLTYFRILDD